MDADKSKPVFSGLEVSWKQVPFKSSTELIGNPSERKQPQPQAVEPWKESYLAEKARDIFSDAGIYDLKSGTGTLKVSLVSYGNWTYKSLSGGFLVDTPFIMILPQSIGVNYIFTAEGEISGKPFKVEESAQLKTTFHALLFPLYPLFRPGSQEKSLIRNMLWKLSGGIYKAGVRK